MSRQSILLACVGILSTVSPAAATETWNCTMHPVGGTEVTPGHAQVQIDQDFVLGTRHYQLLVNNDVGAVAAFAQATTTPPNVTVSGLPGNGNEIVRRRLLAASPNPLIDAYVYALNKRDGSLRSGYVGTNGTHEGQERGECERESPATPSTTP